MLGVYRAKNVCSTVAGMFAPETKFTKVQTTAAKQVVSQHVVNGAQTGTNLYDARQMMPLVAETSVLHKICGIIAAAAMSVCKDA